ncbi:hypothetical protein VNO77_15018 [Canavalia gladiata]|uniref:Uncharacterized protein n=1 Tax=Canavalia gladiata TaxID=3824 RepID=A0AAN9M3Y2_CANGL
MKVKSLLGGLEIWKRSERSLGNSNEIYSPGRASKGRQFSRRLYQESFKISLEPLNPDTSNAFLDCTWSMHYFKVEEGGSARSMEEGGSARSIRESERAGTDSMFRFFDLFVSFAEPLSYEVSQTSSKLQEK